jgi:predicted membrane metal-binding protein
MHVNGCRVEYVPVAYRPRLGRSKIRPLRDTGNFIKLILRTTLYFDPLRVFGPLSAVLFAASLAVLIYGVVSHHILDGTITVLFTAGLQMLSIGLVADLINRKMGR